MLFGVLITKIPMSVATGLSILMIQATLGLIPACTCLYKYMQVYLKNCKKIAGALAWPLQTTKSTLLRAKL